MRLVGAHLRCCVVVDEALSVTVHTPPVAEPLVVGALSVVVIDRSAGASTLPGCCVTQTVGVSAVTVSVTACSATVVVT